MNRHRYGIVLAVIGGLFVTGWTLRATTSGASDDKQGASKEDKTDAPQKKQEAEKKPAPKKIAMKVFMRKKLEASQSLLEGLAVEDFDMIVAGARQLKTTSAAAEFMVINDPIYAQQADEFRRIVDKLEKAGRERRLDGATLAYVDMTMSCVECHKHVRSVLIAGR
jgi:hypothetical protein